LLQIYCDFMYILNKSSSIPIKYILQVRSIKVNIAIYKKFSVTNEVEVTEKDFYFIYNIQAIETEEVFDGF